MTLESFLLAVGLLGAGFYSGRPTQRNSVEGELVRRTMTVGRTSADLSREELLTLIDFAITGKGANYRHDANI